MDVIDDREQQINASATQQRTGSLSLTLLLMISFFFAPEPV
jgi:hypothetical protein